MEENKKYEISYKDLTERILLYFDVFKADLENGMSGNFKASQRARVMSRKITKMLVQYRARSLVETRKARKITKDRMRRK